jgi:hypothetical protein
MVSEGEILANRRIPQRSTCPARLGTDMLHRFSIPSSHSRAQDGREPRINYAKQTQFPGRKNKGELLYRKRVTRIIPAFSLVQNKANFRSRDCFVAGLLAMTDSAGRPAIRPVQGGNERPIMQNKPNFHGRKLVITAVSKKG